MYKKNYLIGIYTYDKYELCITVLEGIQQFMEFTNTSHHCAICTLSKMWKKIQDYIIVDGRKCKVEFININED